MTSLKMLLIKISGKKFIRSCGKSTLAHYVAGDYSKLESESPANGKWE